MTERSNRLYRLWAIASSLLCLALLAYIAAAWWLAPGSVDGQRAAASSTGLPGAEPASIPTRLRNLPPEWMSRALAPGPTGHAVLIDLAHARELIVERCTHRGHFDASRGVPRETDWSFCELVVRGAIESATDSELAVRGADGTLQRFAVELTGPSRELLLTLGDLRLELVEGSRNDLYQRMEAEPEVAAEHQAMLEWMTRPHPEAVSGAGAGS